MLLLLLLIQTVFARPNILLIIADDLGYNDTQLYDPDGIDVPRLEKLASRGVLATQGYVTAPTCGPSRAGMISGRYQQRFGFEYNVGDDSADNDKGLPPGVLTMGDHLRTAGYATPYLGKWHLGDQEPFYPMARGYDSFWGVVAGATAYMDPSSPRVVNVAPPPTSMLEVTPEGLVPTVHRVGLATPREGRNQIVTGDPPTVVHNENVYLTGALAQEAVKVMQTTPSPWFLTVSFTAPHTPFQARDRDIPNDNRPEYVRVYEAMVQTLDRAVGEVLKGAPRDTLVVFFSDNGCAPYTSVCACDPARGGKACHLEGGIRVPFLIGWRGELEAATYTEPISTLDLLPTFLAAAEAPIPEGLDGVNLLPYLRGTEAGAPHDELYWRTGPQQRTVRQGRYKLRKVADWTGTMQEEITILTDLVLDPEEEVNVADQHPETVQQLEAKLTTWENGLMQPLWPSKGNYLYNQCGEWLPFTP